MGGILKLCPTRWTAGANCFRRILDNYNSLLEEWNVCLDSRLEADVRGRILGCQAQMNTFEFFFGLHLGERLFAHTDNLSKTLQAKKMSAINANHVASLKLHPLRKSVVQGMRNNESFNAFYETVLLNKHALPSKAQPTLPRRRRAPARLEVGTGEPSFPSSPKGSF